MLLILWLGIIGLHSPVVYAVDGLEKNPNYNAYSNWKSHHEQVEKALHPHLHRSDTGNHDKVVGNSEMIQQVTEEPNDPEQTNNLHAATTPSDNEKETYNSENGKEFPDFEDSEGIKGNSEMYDYGEDFDCGNETTASACEPGEYECYSGKCIPRKYVCNTVNDCGDLSDEQDCGCAHDEFTCATSRKCIPVQYKCNEYPDCDDKSDEDTEMCKGCNTTTQFTCNSGHCIDLSKLCDDTRDCNDKSDEGPLCDIPHPCESHEFSCQNGNCISMALVCNDENNCGDGSDEVNCQCDERTEFKCDSGKCISKELRCNTADNCRDGSDEIGCHCEEPMYTVCRSDNRCIAAQYKCNNENDCGDWSDEKDCPCASDEFQCQNGHCIDPENLCDGNNDCADWSDEEGCDKCETNEFKCNNDNCISPELVCNGDNNCVDGTDEENCGGCTWTQWAGVGMCSKSCGVGKQRFEREESPWGDHQASDCTNTETKEDECILTGCTASSADEAIEKMEDAARGIDEEITYTMQMIFMEQIEESDKTDACDQFDEMFVARDALLRVPSGRGLAVKSACTSHRGGVTRRADDRSDSVGDYFEFPGRNQGITRTKRRANMGQSMSHEMRQTRLRRRVDELGEARNRNGSKEEDDEPKFHYQVVTPRRAKTGITGLTEDFPDEIKQHEKPTLRVRKGEVDINDQTPRAQ